MKSLFELPKNLPKNQSLFKKCVCEIDNFSTNVELSKALKEYLVLRLSMKDKQIYGVGQWKALLKKLSSLSSNTKEQIKIVRQSIERGWGTFVELNKEYAKNNFGEYQGMNCDTNKDDGIVKGVM